MTKNVSSACVRLCVFGDFLACFKTKKSATIRISALESILHKGNRYIKLSWKFGGHSLKNSQEKAEKRTENAWISCVTMVTRMINQPIFTYILYQNFLISFLRVIKLSGKFIIPVSFMKNTLQYWNSDRGWFFGPKTGQK